MADLVAEVPEQRPIGLVHGQSDPLALGVVRLLDVQRDESVRVPGHHLRAAGRRAQEVEHDPALRILVELRLHRQAERQQLRDETPLRHLDGGPVELVLDLVQVRDRAVQPAGHAEVERVVGGQHPVASRRRVQVGAALVLAGVVRHPPAAGRGARGRAGPPAHAPAGSRAASCSSGTASCGRRCDCRSGSEKRASDGGPRRRAPSTRWTSLARRRRTGSSSTVSGQGCEPSAVRYMFV